MITSITVTNQLSETVTFVLRSPEQSGFFIKEVDGLGPVKADINTSEALSLDGSRFNSARATTRNIVFKIGFLENPSIETSRQNSYKFFPLKSRADIVVETDNKTIKTFGYIESNEPNIFSRDEGTSISIICPDPYLHSITQTIVSFSSVSSLFEFPFSNESLTEKLIIFGEVMNNPQQTITYLGESPVGFVMRIHALGPIHNLSIYNLDTREFMSLDSDILTSMTGSDIIIGDEIVISTIKGEKSITLIRSGEEINILNALDSASSWFVLNRGTNAFYYSTDSGSNFIDLSVEYDTLYEGI